MKVTEFLTGNWGLKILALVLAIVIYYAIKNESASNGRSYDRRIFQQSL